VTLETQTAGTPSAEQGGTMKPVLATGQALVAFCDHTWQIFPFALTEDDLEASDLFVSFEREDTLYDYQIEDAVRIKLDGELKKKHLEWVAVALHSYELHLGTPIISVSADVDFGGYGKTFQLELCYADFQDFDSFCASHEITDQLIETVARERLFETELQGHAPDAVGLQLHYAVHIRAIACADVSGKDGEL
jgi:hypothetical protein